MKDDISRFGGERHSGRPARALWPAIGRGLLMRCPRCGEGKLFAGYLKTVDRCDHCGEDIHHHRADDLPAYLVVFVMSHVIVGLYMASESLVDWNMFVHVAVWSIVTVIGILAALPPTKGAVVGLQWANYMHGFSGEEDEPEPIPGDGGGHR